MIKRNLVTWDLLWDREGWCHIYGVRMLLLLHDLRKLAPFPVISTSQRRNEDQNKDVDCCHVPISAI